MYSIQSQLSVGEVARDWQWVGLTMNFHHNHPIYAMKVWFFPIYSKVIRLADSSLIANLQVKEGSS